MALPSSDRERPLILLLGPPNVGKSVIFNQLSGMDVGMANYPGTTVDYTEGAVELHGNTAKLIDVPGVYSLEAESEAEEVAIRMLNRQPELVVCVLDALNLESSIYLTLQILRLKLPTVVVVNRVDLLAETGRRLDLNLLQEELGVAVIPTVAITGSGLDRLQQIMAETLAPGPRQLPNRVAPSWAAAESIHGRVLSSQGPVSDFRQRIGDAAMRPWPGILIMLAVLTAVFASVVGLGMALRNFILLPLVREGLIPAIVALVQRLIPPGLLREVMVGEYGFLTKGIEWPIALVMPYVLSFYLALSLLEDSGYMPRLGVMLDGLFNKMGLSGTAVVPLLLGYGCGIPAIMSTRALPSRKHRRMVALMVSLSVPCMAQTGAFISLLAARSVGALIFVALLSASAVITAGVVLSRLLPGEHPETVMEIPELLLPRPSVIGKKLWMRSKHYLGDAVLPVVAGVAVAAVLYETGLMTQLGELLRPLVSGWLRLPEDAAVPLLLGIFRRELTVLPLLNMELNALQLTVGSVVALFYVPCVAVLAILIREFNYLFAGAVLVVTTSSAFLMGGVIAHIGAVFF